MIRDEGADVFGISSDTVDALKKFHKNHRLNFVLLSDTDGKVLAQYGTKMPLLNFSKRHTFVIGPDLIIRAIDKDVDPVRDSEKMAAEIKQLKTKNE